MMRVGTAEREAIIKTVPVEDFRLRFPILSPLLGNRAVSLIRIDMACATGAFKEYGVGEIVQEMKYAGHDTVTTASAGSQALSVVYNGAIRGMNVQVAVPGAIAPEKEAALYKIWNDYALEHQRLRIDKIGESYDDAQEYAEHSYEPTTFIPPFNHPGLIRARQAIYRDAAAAAPYVTDWVVPIGGGSLFAAMSLATQNSDDHVWGVEAEGNDSLSKTITSGSAEPLEATRLNRRYSGSAVRKTGQHVLSVLRNIPNISDRFVTAVDDVVHSIAYHESMYEGTQLEPTALLAVAGVAEVVKYARSDATIGVIASGHNESPKRLLAA